MLSVAPPGMESPTDQSQNFRHCCDPCVRTREHRNGAGSHVQSRLLRAVLSKRQLPETGDREAPTIAAATSVRPIAMGPIRTARGATAITAGTVMSSFWPGDVAAGVVGGAVGTSGRQIATYPASLGEELRPSQRVCLCPRDPVPRRGRPDGISASKAGVANRAKRRPEGPPFSCRSSTKVVLSGSGPLQPSLIFEPPKIGPRAAGYFTPSPIASIRRLSSAVEQRFCKPKVGSSILSTGTRKPLYFSVFFANLGRGIRQDDDKQLSRQALKQAHLFGIRSRLPNCWRRQAERHTLTFVTARYLAYL